MATSSFIEDFIRLAEGGNSSNKTDLAAANVAPDTNGIHTVNGITYLTFVAYAQANGIAFTSKNFLKIGTDKKLWQHIFVWNTWNKIKGAKIASQAIAGYLADFYFNAGANAVKQLQEVLNRDFKASLAVDGVMGDLTIYALNAATKKDEKKVLDLYYAERKLYYNNVVKAKPQQSVFLAGWLKRADSLYSKVLPFVGTGEKKKSKNILVKIVKILIGKK